MNAKSPPQKLSRQIVEEASAWFVDFRVGDLDAFARERFDQWLRRSPEHIRAYMEIAKTYVELPALKSDRKVDVNALIAYARADANVVSFDRPALGATQASSGASLPRAEAFLAIRRTWLTSRAVAASVALLCMSSALLTWLWLHRYPTYSTDIGEMRSITLADGSTIDLNARSQVRIQFSKGERTVELLDGQALFEVAKDRGRPFVVRSGAALVRAVGTQFDVNQRSSDTTVTVVEGRVVVVHKGSTPADLGPSGDTAGIMAPASPKSDAHRATYVSAGEQVTVSAARVTEPKHADVAAATAWTQHRLIFDGSRLSDVVDDVNRYSTRQIVIEGAELSDLQVSGVYASTDPASLIRFLREQPRIQVTYTDDAVHISLK